MPLAAGARLGAYDILGLIGAGGMGEVYRARDGKLQRDVAIKILPDLFAADPERLARFEREAQVLASLNHPNIAAIYGSEESNGVRALVLELVEGPTLADRIAQGAMPLDEVLPIARQIAEALEAAHEHGVIHRDLKPANIKVRADGMVKVLDFGLAKVFEGAASATPAPQDALYILSQSPTITSPAATRLGTILGTAAYMSPEQARGKAVDKRTDIWAFGCVLYEMLSGRRPFEGSEVTDVWARVLEREPDYAALSAQTPEPIRRVIRRCLEKDPRERLPHIGLARLEIRDARSDATLPATRPSGSQRQAALRYGILATVAGTLGAVLSAVWVGTPTAAPLWFSILAPQPNAARADAQIPGTAYTATQGVAAAALSLDGTRIAFSAPDGTGSYSMWVRRFDSPATHLIPETQGALLPFWSPDGQSLAFFADGRLKRVDLAGGGAQTLADAAGPRGGAWGRNGDIVFMPATQGEGLFRVAPTGGTVTRVTRLSAERQEVEHLYPHFLPDGRRFLYFAGSLDDRYTGVYMASLDGGEPRLVVPMQSRAEYADGYLVFGRGRDLLAQRFDIDTLMLAGEPVRLGEPVGTSFGSFQNYAFTTAGPKAIAFLLGPRARNELVHVNAAGEVVRSLAGSDAWISMAISPDGTRLALERLDEDGKSADVWTLDLATEAVSRFTTFSGPWRWFGTPVWSHDGTRLLVTNFTGPYWVRPVRRPGEAGERLPHKLDGNGGWPTDWSADGTFVVAGQNDPATSQDIWVLPTAPAGQPVSYAKTPFSEHGGRLSPDGRWLAWTSNESGQNEVYVDSFPMPSGKALVSRGGGAHARWRRDGRALYYLAPHGTLMSAGVATNTDQIRTDAPVTLFRLPGAISDPFHRSVYEVLGNGGFVFMVNSTLVRAQESGITVVMNWTSALSR